MMILNDRDTFEDAERFDVFSEDADECEYEDASPDELDDIDDAFDIVNDRGTFTSDKLEQADSEGEQVSIVQLSERFTIILKLINNSSKKSTKPLFLSKTSLIT